MTEKKRHEEEQEAARPHVRVTDKRRVRSEGTEASEPIDVPSVSGTPSGSEVSAMRGGSATTEGSGRSEAPLPSADAEQQLSEYREHLQRLAAEFDNYRKRVLKEQTRAVEMASEPLIRRILEVLDEFELALMAAEQKPDFDRFLHGVELVYAKLVDSLRGEGLEKIPAKGKPFDPSLHEALMQSGEGEGEPVVADVLREGYTLRGRVIRPAGVKVVRR